MPITKNGITGIIEYTAPTDFRRFLNTGVINSTQFAISADSDKLKQINFDPTAQLTNTKYTIATPSDTTGDVTLTLPRVSGSIYSEPVKDFGTNIPATTDRDGLAQAQTLGASGNLILNGAGISSGAYDCGFYGGRKITLYSTGNLSGRTFTITGTDQAGTAQTENITGPNNTTVTGSNYFKTVTSVAVNGSVGTNVEAGFAASLIALKADKERIYKLNPANSETILIACYGESATVSESMSLALSSPATLTVTWADGTTPSDRRIYFPGGIEPTPTSSGVDWFEFVSPIVTASGDAVWYGFTCGQDIKA